MSEKDLKPPLMIAMCIYQLGNRQSYIANPVLKPSSMTCVKPLGPWRFVDRFYAINPMFTPIPSYLRLICAKRSVSGEHTYSTVSVVNNYDPFNLDDDCVYFLSWTQPVPYSTPLYIYKGQEGVLISFERKDIPQEDMSPIFVLTEQPKSSTIRPMNNWFEMNNGTPIFLFQDYNGRCIPNPEGIPLELCSLQTTLGMQKPLSLLEILEREEKEKGNRVTNWFRNVGSGWISVFLAIALASLIVVLILINKGETPERKNVVL